MSKYFKGILDIPSILGVTCLTVHMNIFAGLGLGAEGHSWDLALVGYKFKHYMYKQRGHSIKLWKNYMLSW